MIRKTFWGFVLACFLFVCLFAIVGQSYGADKPMIFGLLMVGPYNDHGWSQAHYEAGHYVEKKVPGTKMIYIDKVNPADRPGVTIPQLVDDMVEKGATLIIANSDDMKDGTREAAKMHPDVYFIHISGDDVLTGKATPNMSNLMGRMEYGKMMAGFVAAMATKTGKIGYLGPLINEETRRLAASCYLGAKYAWENVLKKDPKELTFKVTWIGFWFNIPGVTKSVITCAKRRPPTTISPRGLLEAPSAPNPSAIGSEPIIVDAPVMRIGRKRTRHALYMASKLFIFFSSRF